MATEQKKAMTRRPMAQMNHLVSELSHDMNANFMVLEHSFRHLKEHVDENPLPSLIEDAAHVEACLRESKRLIDDLVTLAKTGAVHMEPQRVDLAKIVSETIYEQDELLRRRGVAINVQLRLPAVWCNPKRLKQIVTNLIRNSALHGCDPDEPRLSLSASPVEPEPSGDSQAQPMVRLVVFDNGPGIPASVSEEIFLPGKRLPASHSEGSGMGLAIVRRIAEFYGGMAMVDPDCTDGTAIVVTLPGVPHS